MSEYFPMLSQSDTVLLLSILAYTATGVTLQVQDRMHGEGVESGQDAASGHRTSSADVY